MLIFLVAADAVAVAVNTITVVVVVDVVVDVVVGGIEGDFESFSSWFRDILNLGRLVRTDAVFAFA